MDLTLHGNAIDAFAHPVVSAFVEVHGEVLAYVPSCVNDFRSYWHELGNTFMEMEKDPGEMGARLVSGYPIAATMQSFMLQLGGTYPPIAHGAWGIVTGYDAANPFDVQRNLEPRNNEQWANVGAGPEPGYGYQMAQRLRGAHAALFAYEPEDPIDLENLYSALPHAFMTMAGQVEAGRQWCCEYFPGAADIPDQFFTNLGNAYVSASIEAVQTLTGYRDVAAQDLNRHHNQRVEEQKADVA